MSLVYQATATVAGGPRPGLYLGGKADAKDLKRLEDRQVTHILNMTPAKNVNVKAGVPNYFESTKSFVYKRIPLYDASTSVGAFADAADEVISFIAKGLCHGSVFVHCQRGVSRSTTAVILYLMKRAGMSLQASLEMIRRRRPQAQPIPAFLKFLEGYYEKECQSLGEESAKKRAAVVGPPARGPPKKPRTAGPVAVEPSLPPPIAAAPLAQDVQPALKATPRTVDIGPSFPPPYAVAGAPVLSKEPPKEPSPDEAPKTRSLSVATDAGKQGDRDITSKE